MTELAALTPEQYDRLQSVIRPYLDKALSFSDRDYESVYNGIQAGWYKVLALYDTDRIEGAMVLEPGPDNIHVFLLGGELPDRWLDEIIPALDKLAACQGKTDITCAGRKGWARKLKHYGFHMEQLGGEHYLRRTP